MGEAEAEAEAGSEAEAGEEPEADLKTYNSWKRGSQELLEKVIGNRAKKLKFR